MADGIVIDVDDYQRPLGLHLYISDFANVLKPFIGSNFLSIPFGLRQCGLAVGIVGLVIIASLTGHCCHLLVKCRYHAIDLICQLYQNRSNDSDDSTNSEASDDSDTKTPSKISKYRPPLVFDHLVSSEVLERKVTSSEEDLQQLRKRLVKTIQYGDLAHMCLGWWGLTIVNAAIVLTQVGFTTNYVIFTANTLYSFFPVYNCTIVTRDNETLSRSPDCSSISRASVDLGPGVNNSINSHDSNPQPFGPASSFSYNGSDSGLPDAQARSSTTYPTLSFLVTDPLSATSNVSVWTEVWSTAPDLRLLVLVPVAIFIILVLPRNLRGLGFISAIGNIGIMSGALMVLLALIAEFKVSDTWQLARMEGLPIFFGTVAGAFEGAGMILPVESSMDGNHHNFPPLLAACITLVLLIYEGVCVLSYLSYGDTVAQMVTMNITPGSGMSVAVDVCLMVGIICTFPIMMYPAVTLLEVAFWGPDGACNGVCKKEESDDEEKTPLSPTKQDQIAPWKRNALGITLVLILGVLGVLLRDSFAYISAFLGALGSTVVAYILPCMFHLRLCWPHLPLLIRIKDLTIIAVGAIFAVTGVYSVIGDLTS